MCRSVGGWPNRSPRWRNVARVFIEVCDRLPPSTNGFNAPRSQTGKTSCWMAMATCAFSTSVWRGSIMKSPASRRVKQRRFLPTAWRRNKPAPERPGKPADVYALDDRLLAPDRTVSYCSAVCPRPRESKTIRHAAPSPPSQVNSELPDLWDNILCVAWRNSLAKGPPMRRPSSRKYWI